MFTLLLVPMSAAYFGSLPCGHVHFMFITELDGFLLAMMGTDGQSVVHHAVLHHLLPRYNVALLCVK